MPRRVPELEYGDDVVRRISQQGSLKWNGERTFVSEIFAYEWMGLRALDERYYEVLYGPVTVGFLDTFQHVFHRALNLALRRRLGMENHQEPVEMPDGGKPGNPNPGFPPFPPSLEIAARFPHSHTHDSSYNHQGTQNRLLKVLPMSPDRSVTYVPGRTNLSELKGTPVTSRDQRERFFYTLAGTTNGARYCREIIVLAWASPTNRSVAGSNSSLRPVR